MPLDQDLCGHLKSYVYPCGTDRVVRPDHVWRDELYRDEDEQCDCNGWHDPAAQCTDDDAKYEGKGDITGWSDATRGEHQRREPVEVTQIAR